MKKTCLFALLFAWCLPLGAADGGAGAWRGYAAKLMQARRPDAALQAYGKALRLDPKDAIAWAGAGNAQWALGRKPEALRYWKASLRLQPGNRPLADFVAKLEPGSPVPAAAPAAPAMLASAESRDEKGTGDWMGTGMKGLFLGLGVAVVALF